MLAEYKSFTVTQEIIDQFQIKSIESKKFLADTTTFSSDFQKIIVQSIFSPYIFKIFSNHYQMMRRTFI